MPKRKPVGKKKDKQAEVKDEEKSNNSKEEKQDEDILTAEDETKLQQMETPVKVAIDQ